MSIELAPADPEETTSEYILVSDRDSSVVFSTGSTIPPARDPLAAAIKLAALIRKSGGEVTIFKATKY
jgi:hypothetical protein